MFSQLKDIERLFIESGKKLVFKKQELLAREGERCTSILYILQKTRLNYNGREVELDAGEYLHMKEYVRNEPYKNDIIALQTTLTMVIEQEAIEHLKRSNNLFSIFLIQKLSQQAPLEKTTYE